MRDMTLSAFNRPTIISASITRPANTTAYAADDVVADSASAPTAQKILLAASQSGGHGKIVSAMLQSSANQATKLQADVYLFNAAIGLDNDNAVFTPTDAEMLTCVAIIPFYNKAPALTAADANVNTTTECSIVGDATAGAGGNCVFVKDDLNKIFKCASTSRDLWWAIVPRNAYTPVSGEVFNLRLTVMQDG